MSPSTDRSTIAGPRRERTEDANPLEATMRSPRPLPPAARPMRVIVPAAVLVLLSCLLALPAAAPAQQGGGGAGASAADRGRPVPNPVVPPRGYRRAVDAGTRTTEGRPGDAYWQQWTEYDIDARLLPGPRRLVGSETIRHHNRSPDTLDALYLHLHQNIHRSGGTRVEEQPVTDALDVDAVRVDGELVKERPGADGPGYEVDGTVLEIRPPRPVPPGTTVELSLDWSFPVARSTTGRAGWSGEDLFFVGYWYPRMAAYDDVVGWQTRPFLGTGEFYDGFGRYDVEIELPEGWVVRATGELRNRDEVFPPEIRERLRRAERSDTVVHVLGDGDFGAGEATVDSESGRLTWRFVADTVRDFAFSATRRSRWDAARTPVGDRDGDGETEYARVESIWREEAPRWQHVWRYAQHSIDFFSRYTGLPYPWPHMTAVEGGGIIGGGMEYPMMTLIGDYTASTDSALYWVTGHELAHMWVPMILSTDEKRYAWLDEGTTTFSENEARKEYFETDRGEAESRESYLRAARAERELPMMRWADYYRPGTYGVASYSKPATVLEALRAVLGEEVFTEAFRTFMQEWRYRHPYPWDLFRTFERVSGRELDWFWRTWYYETWTMDQAVAGVRASDAGVVVTVEDRGRAPMPILLSVTPEGGATVTRRVDVDAWLDGATEVEVDVPLPEGARGRPVLVEIDPSGDFPDVDRSDNVWEGTP